MTVAGISPTYNDRPCAITRTRRHCRVQFDINFRRQFWVVSYFTHLFHPHDSRTTLLYPRLAIAVSPIPNSSPGCNAHSWGDAVPRGFVQHVFSPPARIRILRSTALLVAAPPG